jgi:hypothetical protein
MSHTTFLLHHLPTDGDDERPRKVAKEQATTMVTAKRFFHTLAIAALFFGLMLTISNDASARKTVQTYTSADCAFLFSNFMIYSEKAGEAANEGNFEDANFYTQLASQAINSARRGGCAWPGEVFPTT